MAQGLLVFLLVLIFGDGDGYYLGRFEGQDVFEGDETGGVLGLEAVEVEKGHCRVEHLHVLLLEQFLPDPEGILFLDAWLLEEVEADEKGSQGHGAPQQHLLPEVGIPHCYYQK